jgi:hypothetical protein
VDGYPPYVLTQNLTLKSHKSPLNGIAFNRKIWHPEPNAPGANPIRSPRRPHACPQMPAAARRAALDPVRSFFAFRNRQNFACSNSITSINKLINKPSISLFIVRVIVVIGATGKISLVGGHKPLKTALSAALLAPSIGAALQNAPGNVLPGPIPAAAARATEKTSPVARQNCPTLGSVYGRVGDLLEGACRGLFLRCFP